MHLAVCIKYIPDPEAAFSMFSIDEAAKKVVPASGLKHVVSPFDEQAIEAALRIREAHAGTRITVITFGNELSRNALKHGLAMGADDGVLLSDAAFDDGDSYTTASVLSAALKKLGVIDLVLTGRQAADGDAGIVGAGIAELLDRPLLTFAKSVAIENSVVRVERVLEDGTETLETDLPAVVTVSNEIGAPRAPSLRETMRAARKPVQMWKAADLGLDAAMVGAAGARSVREKLFAPSKTVQCEFIEAVTPEKQGARLAARLREAKVV
ncbi:MAG: electron transfer flavoprotein subunit beta/FixA family protein [Betaproteobacteria bacterium]|nr:electron transfer flavoprotein subunit beta/FixA family protein [Betaproteobacteria bacterium]